MYRKKQHQCEPITPKNETKTHLSTTFVRHRSRGQFGLLPGSKGPKPPSATTPGCDVTNLGVVSDWCNKKFAFLGVFWGLIGGWHSNGSGAGAMSMTLERALPIRGVPATTQKLFVIRELSWG